MQFAQQPWRQLSVQVTWPDGRTGSAIANCNTNRLNPELATGMMQVGDPSTPIEQDGVVTLGESVYDTTQVVEGTGTVTRQGTLTYTLYRSEDCAGGTAVFGPETFTLSGSELPASSSFVVNAPGTYNWVVTFSGDANNAAATSGCGEETFVVLAPDVEVVKQAADESVSAGEAISFTITVSNIGEGLATEVALSDELPTGFDWTIQPAVEGCAISDGTLSCEARDLASGDDFSVTVTAITAPDNCGVVSNTATASVANEPNDTRNNNSSTSTIAINCPDIDVVKTATTSPISAGDVAEFQIVVTNIGEGAATAVVVEDVLPAGLTWSVSPAVDGCSIAGGELNCSFASLDANGSITITLTATTAAANCGILQNQVTASATNEPQDTLENNQSSALLDVDCPGILVEKTSTTPIVSAGEPIEYTITISNPQGEEVGNAYDVVLTDSLPEGIVWSIEPANEDCDLDGLDLSCAVGTLAPGASFSATVVGETTGENCGVVTNIARGTASNEPTEDPYINEDAESITILCPDLTVEKTTDTPVVSATDAVQFGIVVTNSGEGTAYDVVVSDVLPSGIEWTAAPGAPDCVIADGTLTCSIAELGSEDTFEVVLTGTSTPDVCGTLSNTVNVAASNEAEEDQANNDATADIEVLCPDVVVQKTADTPVVSAGDQIGFSITVGNDGEGTAYDVDLSDNLPAGIEWAISPANADCEIQTGDGSVLTCQIGTMLPGDEFTVSVVGETDPTDCGVITNIAVVSALNEANEAEANNEADAQLEVLCPDIAVEKSTDTPVVSASDQVSFTIAVENIGEGRADNVVIEDVLPAGIEWTISPDQPLCAITDGTLGCQIEALPAGDIFTVTVVGTTDPTDCGVLENTASASASNEAQEDQENNDDAAEIEVLCPDLAVEKVTDTPVVSAADVASFTVQVSNIGDGNAYDVALNDPLPAGILWVIEPEVDGCAIDGGTLTCAFGTLASGDEVTVTVVGTTDAADCGVLENTASSSASNEAEIDLENNASSAEMEVLCPDIAVEKVANETVISAGDQARFTITITNIGDGNAYDVELSDPLPAGVLWAIDPAVDGCAISDNVMACSFGTFEPDQTLDISVIGTPPASACGVLLNVATGFASNEVPDAPPADRSGRLGWMQTVDVTANNTASAEIEVLCPDLTVEKTAANTAITAGDQASFTITVSNLGEGNAYDVVVRDDLPAGFNWRAESMGAVCGADGGVLTCAIATLAPGASETIVVSAPSTTSNCGDVVNTVSVLASNEGEDVPGNNDAEASLTITCPPPTTTPGTPIHTLPVTGSGDAAGVGMPTWMLAGGALVALMAAVVIATGDRPLRRRG